MMKMMINCWKKVILFILCKPLVLLCLLGKYLISNKIEVEPVLHLRLFELAGCRFLYCHVNKWCSSYFNDQDNKGYQFQIMVSKDNHSFLVLSDLKALQQKLVWLYLLY